MTGVPGRADAVLTGGQVVDGTGAPCRPADLAVAGGRVVEIAAPGRGESTGPRLDVTGLAVAPGFIDMHAHSDLAVLADPNHEAKVHQGVTCEVLGQDGLSYAPVTDSTLPRLQAQLAGWHGTPDLDYTWRGVGQYLDRVDSGVPVNAAYLVPHGNVRMAVLGEEERAPSADELEAMRARVAEGMAGGAMGLSTGLTYTPGMYATDDEIVALLDPVRAAGGYYCPHHRNYGDRVVESYRECLEISRRSGVALHLAHCHVNYPMNKGRAGEVLALVDDYAQRHGLDVSLDTYPYDAGATYLGSVLPSWALAGGVPSALTRLRDPDVRRRILHEVEVLGTDGHHGLPVDWATVVVTGVQDRSLSWAVGASIADLAATRGARTGELFADLLVADGMGTGCRLHVGNEENIRTVMAHPAHTGGSDGILVGERPHPRGWGTFARFLGTYVRELGVLELEECVAHLTSRAARRLGLRDRGVLRAGAAADIVVFDPVTVAAGSTYGDPRRTPDGIPHVLVNGQFTVRDGRRTDRLPGRALRGPGWRG